MLTLGACFSGRDDLITHSPVVAIPELPVFLLDEPLNVNPPYVFRCILRT